MDEMRAIERITETANLTDGLEDDDANWLLDWAIAQVRNLIRSIEDEAAAGEKVSQLMAVVRRLNRIVADRAARPIEDMADAIRALADDYERAFGHSKVPVLYEAVISAAQIGSMAPREALQFLIELVSGEQAPPGALND